ncbi:hypothetical protein HDV05_004900 [Chytridiales sp. JEL 0842]|nr:hypothetical protein HDV05_004900 [Chytridiales sp. JEL 0842]
MNFKPTKCCPPNKTKLPSHIYSHLDSLSHLLLQSRSRLSNWESKAGARYTSSTTMQDDGGPEKVYGSSLPRQDMSVQTGVEDANPDARIGRRKDSNRDTDNWSVCGADWDDMDAHERLEWLLNADWRDYIDLFDEDGSLLPKEGGWWEGGHCGDSDAASTVVDVEDGVDPRGSPDLEWEAKKRHRERVPLVVHVAKPTFTHVEDEQDDEDRGFIGNDGQEYKMARWSHEPLVAPRYRWYFRQIVRERLDHDPMDFVSFIDSLRSHLVKPLVKITFAGLNYASAQLFVLLRAPSDVHPALNLLRDKGLRVVAARPKVLESSGSKESLKGDEKERSQAEFMRQYYGFDKMDNGGRHAIFKDALTASFALHDLLAFSNIGATFVKWEEPVETKSEPAVAAESTPESTENAEPKEVAETSKDKPPSATPEPTETTKTPHQGKTLFIRGIPSTRDLRRSESDKAMMWGRQGIIAGLVSFFARYNGFVKISFRMNAVVLVDFADDELAAKALARFNATTKMSAVYAKARGTDPVLLPLEAPCPTIFLRLDPPGINFDDAVGLIGRKGYLLEAVEKGEGRSLLASFATVEKAAEVVEDLRSKTNLVVNFSKFDISPKPAFEKPAQKPFEKPFEKPAENFSEGSTEKPAEKTEPTVKAIDKPISKPTEKSVETSLEKPVEKPVVILKPTTTPSVSHTSKAPLTPTLKEWSGLRILDPPAGLNTRELLGRDPGFLCILYEAEGTQVALFETGEAASESLAFLRRLLASDVELAYGSIPPKRPTPTGKGFVEDPTGVLGVVMRAGVNEVLLRALMKGYEGFIELRCTKGIGHVRFGSVARTRKALEDIAVSTNLEVGYMDIPESFFSDANSPVEPVNPKMEASRKQGHQTPAQPQQQQQQQKQSEPKRQKSRIIAQDIRVLDGELVSRNTAKAPPKTAESTSPATPTVNNAPVTAVDPSKALRGDPKRTLHVMFPPADTLEFKKFCIDTLKAERVIFMRTSVDTGSSPKYMGAISDSDDEEDDEIDFDMKQFESLLGPPFAFVVFASLEAAATQGPKINEQWAKAKVTYASEDYVPPKGWNLQPPHSNKLPPASRIGKPTRVLKLKTGGMMIWEELDGLLLGYKGYEDVEFYAGKVFAYFDSANDAKEALEDLLKFTGIGGRFSRRDEDEEVNGVEPEDSVVAADVKVSEKPAPSNSNSAKTLSSKPSAAALAKLVPNRGPKPAATNKPRKASVDLKSAPIASEPVPEAPAAPAAPKSESGNAEVATTEATAGLELGASETLTSATGIEPTSEWGSDSATTVVGEWGATESASEWGTLSTGKTDWGAGSVSGGGGGNGGSVGGQRGGRGGRGRGDYGGGRGRGGYEGRGGRGGRGGGRGGGNYQGGRGAFTRGPQGEGQGFIGVSSGGDVQQ